MEDRGIQVAEVSYVPTNVKHYPMYRGLLENCLTNGTLPSIAFGFSSCSQKHKIAPQNKFLENWEPAVTAWSQGLKVTRCIGYDTSPADLKRYAEREGYVDDRFDYDYPLRRWGWTRDDCAQSLAKRGLPEVKKSACFFCTATKPIELHEYPKAMLRLIVLMEARAAPRLRNVEGLWRKAVKGNRGGTPKPGAMTDYIREQALLPADEIDLIVNEAPRALITWQEAQSILPLSERPAMREWVDFFDRNIELFREKGVIELYEGAPGGDPRLKEAA